MNRHKSKYFILLRAMILVAVIVVFLGAPQLIFKKKSVTDNKQISVAKTDEKTTADIVEATTTSASSLFKSSSSNPARPNDIGRSVGLSIPIKNPPTLPNTANPLNNLSESNTLNPSTSSTSQSTSSEVQQTSSLPPEQLIDPQSIVGIVCYFDTTLTNPQNGVSVSGGQDEYRGSGVIINVQGYILTNRHLVASENSFATIQDKNGNPLQIIISYRLDHCEVGQVPAGTHLPTPDEIRSINPFFQLPVLSFTARPMYISSTDGLSANEIQFADFAILKITGLTQSGPTFGVTSVPSSFSYAKLLPTSAYLKIGDFVITYGFPGDVTQGQRNAFETLTMTGSIGNVTGIDFGDKYYGDIPLTIHTKMEIYHGRSGSPLFWRGYVIGLITFYTGDNRTDSGSVASDVILKSLQLWGL